MIRSNSPVPLIPAKGLQRADYGVAAISVLLALFSSCDVPAAEFDVLTSRVSPAAAGPHFWWNLQWDPSAPSRAIVCALRNDPSHARILDTVLYGTEDGGSTWREIASPISSAADSEVACTVGSDGSLYLAYSGGPELPTNVLTAKERLDVESMHFLRSENFGLTWEQTFKCGYQDSAVLVALPQTRGYPDVVALLSHGGDGKRLTLVRSADSGRQFKFGVETLSVPTGKADPQWLFWITGATKTVQNEVGVVYLDPALTSGDSDSKRAVMFARIGSNGKLLARPVQVSRLSAHFGGISEARSAASFVWERSPQIAAGRTHGRDRVFVVWHDQVDGQSRIVVASTDDAGKTWKERRGVDDFANSPSLERGASRSHPSIAVNAEGIVGIEWAEFDGKCWRFAASGDGGLSFGNSIALNPCRPTAQALAVGLHGHIDALPALTRVPQGVQIVITDWRRYWNVHRGMSLVGVGNSFHALWASFGSADDGIYHTRISPISTSSGSGSPPFVPASDSSHGKMIASLIDDGSVWLDYTNVDYNEAAGEFSIGVVVAATKKVRWPLLLRLRRMKSVLGRITAVGTDNGIKEAGAVWEFAGPAIQLPPGSSAALDQATLRNGEFRFSHPRTVKFRLEDINPTASLPADGSAQLLSIEADILQIGPPEDSDASNGYVPR